jgi:hypothetical protein
MTIAAGFSAGGSVILCADSEETISDYAKSAAQKIFTCSFGDSWRLAIAGAGDASLIELFQEELTRRIAGDQFDYGGIHQKIEFTLRQIHKLHVWPRTGGNQTSFQLLIALQWKDPGGAALFVTQESVLLPVHGFQTIGIGKYLADYLLTRIYAQGEIYKARSEEVMRVAIFVLDQVKSAIQGCDGQTHLFVMNAVDGSERYVVGPEVTMIEHEFQVFNQGQTRLFRAFALPTMPREAFISLANEAAGKAIEAKTLQYSGWDAIQRGIAEHAAQIAARRAGRVGRKKTERAAAPPELAPDSNRFRSIKARVFPRK